MEYWPLRAPNADFRLSVDQTTRLLSRIGERGGKMLAAELLKLVTAQVPLAQCTIFAYGAHRSPKVISFADRARMLELPSISHSYAARFYSLDGNQQAMAHHLQASAGERILVQRQSLEDIAHREYRRICYEAPRISERLALLTQCEGDRWLSVNFYRGYEHPPFSANEINLIEAMTPLIMQIVRLEYRAHLETNAMPAVLADRVIALFPELTRRDRELLQLMLGGAEVNAISSAMGVQLSSAATYIKRLYRKLGIASQRELLALATQPRERFEEAHPAACSGSNGRAWAARQAPAPARPRN